MANPENPQNIEEHNITEILSQYLAGRIKREDLSEENQGMLDQYGPGGLMDSDPNFATVVNARVNQIREFRKNTFIDSTEVKKKRRGRKSKKEEKEPVQETKPQGYIQGEFFQSDFRSGLDPERRIMKVGAYLNSRFRQDRKSILNQEVKHKREELRDAIGLPQARGKDPHVNDKFYKYLVNKVVRYDKFGIFREYDRVITEPPPELKLKIGEITEFIDEVLNGDLNRPQRFQRCNQFKEEFKKKWGE